MCKDKDKRVIDTDIQEYPTICYVEEIEKLWIS